MFQDSFKVKGDVEIDENVIFKLHQFGFLKSLMYYKVVSSTVTRNWVYFLLEFRLIPQAKT